MLVCPRQESNLQLLLRTESLYPFNYEDYAHNLAQKELFWNWISEIFMLK